MGKWCFSGIELSPEIKRISAELATLSEREVNARWINAGSLTIDQLNLSWYSGISGDGWACIDNSAGEKNFQMWANRGDYLYYSADRMMWERKACIIYVEMQRAGILPSPSSTAVVEPSAGILAIDSQVSDGIPLGEVVVIKGSSSSGRPATVTHTLHSMPRQYSLVKYKPTVDYDMFGGSNPQLIFLGEIPNMPGHCAVASKHGKVYFGYHTDDFVELTAEEV